MDSCKPCCLVDRLKPGNKHITANNERPPKNVAKMV